MKGKNGNKLILGMSVDAAGINDDRFIIVDFDNASGDVCLCSVRYGSSIWRHHSNVIEA